MATARAFVAEAASKAHRPALSPPAEAPLKNGASLLKERRRAAPAEQMDVDAGDDGSGDAAAGDTDAPEPAPKISPKPATMPVVPELSIADLEQRPEFRTVELRNRTASPA